MEEKNFYISYKDLQDILKQSDIYARFHVTNKPKVYRKVDSVNGSFLEATSDLAFFIDPKKAANRDIKYKFFYLFKVINFY